MKARLKFQISFLAFIVGIVQGCNGQAMKTEDNYSVLRQKMVEQQIKKRGIHNPDVLAACSKVPRHMFVPIEFRKYAYDDTPVPIGFDQTISQPYIVAFMTEILNPGKNTRVLEIGTGSGYQAAILACLCKEVYSVEIIDSLAERAKKTINYLGYKNIHLKTADGYKGWKEYAPYDAIIVTCAPEKIPEALLEQLAEGGRMIIPAGDDTIQKLYLIEKVHGKIRQKETMNVLFVPMQHGIETGK
jgi:protein-L-isoaspartate(D-aspartate) O-methyltransferase